MMKNFFSKKILLQSTFIVLTCKKNDPLAFLEKTYYILERLTISYAMFILIEFFSLPKETNNTCAIHAQFDRQARVTGFLPAGLFEFFSCSVNEM